jgi:hypothetical protein
MILKKVEFMHISRVPASRLLALAIALAAASFASTADALSTAGQASRPVPQTAGKRRAGALSSVRVKWFAKASALVVVVAAVAEVALLAVREVVEDPVLAVRAVGPEALPVLAALLVVVPLALTTSPRSA